MEGAPLTDRLPPGQVLTEKWPVLTNGAKPRVGLQTWSFRSLGLVHNELSPSGTTHESFEFLDVNTPGFREVNGDHLRADPWKEERYSDHETDAMQRMRAEAAPPPKPLTRPPATSARRRRHFLACYPPRSGGDR